LHHFGDRWFAHQEKQTGGYMTDLLQNDLYGPLAPIYREAGLADYSMNIGPALINLAFDLNWEGGTLLELACGTGDLACWFAAKSLRTTAMDISAAMLKRGVVKGQEMGVGVDFQQADLRTYTPTSRYDLIVSVGQGFNYLPSVRDLDRLFKAVRGALNPGKLFIFDLRTIKGLANHQGEHVLADSETFMLISQAAFNFEALSLLRRYTLFRRETAASGHQRSDTLHTLRGYPVAGVVRQLEGAGLKVVRTLTHDMLPYDDDPEADVVLLVATTA
jgi:SAM-dependent methyltransferase